MLIASKLSNFTISELKKLSKNIRKKIINSVSKNGGHLSSNLGVVELTIALYKNFNFLNDKLLFDIGHQSYTHKILTGRDINKIRKKNGISGFIKQKESKYDVFEAGHSSTSLSAAIAFAIDREKKHKNYEIIVVIGDASLLNGIAFEALNYIVCSKYKIIIVVNNNGMSINKTIGDINYLLNNQHFNLIKNIDGHNFNSLNKALKLAKKSKKAIILEVKTIKGKGLKFAENDSTGIWHEPGKFNAKSGLFNEPNYNNTWTTIYSNLIEQKLHRNKKFLLICPGTLKTISLSRETINKFSNQIFDVGIAEELAVILAAQLSKLGYEVCVSIYSTFLQRSFDQIIHDVCRINANITFLIERSGFSGENGETHHGIFDTPFLMSIPNFCVSMASDITDAKMLLNYSKTQQMTNFIRIPKEKITIGKNITKYNLKDFYILNKNFENNYNLAIVSVGPLTNTLFEEIKDFNICIYNPIILTPIKPELIQKILNYKNIIIYTPYETNNGYAKQLTYELALKNFTGKIYIKAISKYFIECMSIQEQLEENHLLPTQIKTFIENLKYENN
ncbi:MAG: 1-deoxy-D-xylulose-5-phosphate synthase [Bacilli bacterium]|nr:1-deoxy-D-xylulose-5-phosphate synthase [Bacilli bacterium]